MGEVDATVQKRKKRLEKAEMKRRLTEFMLNSAETYCRFSYVTQTIRLVLFAATFLVIP